jgi:hypothetical protein
MKNGVNLRTQWMNFNGVRSVQYDGNIWNSDQPVPALAKLLAGKDCLISLAYSGPPYQVTLGVPHHAVIGAKQICERRLDERNLPNPRDADENAALFALAAFSALKEAGIPSKLVIMAHATGHDPNKIPESPYCQAVLGERTRLLFECHGSGVSRRLPLELSAGSNHLVKTLRFGRALAYALGHRFALGVQKRAEKREAIILRTDGDCEKGSLELAAKHTASLIEAEKQEIPALHLEAKPVFRRAPDLSSRITPEGLLLGQAIARSVIQYFSFV